MESLSFFDEIVLADEIRIWRIFCQRILWNFHQGLNQDLETWEPNTTHRWPLWYNPKFPWYYVFIHHDYCASPQNSFCAKTPLTKEIWIMWHKNFKCLQKIHGPAGIAGSHSTKPKGLKKHSQNLIKNPSSINSMVRWMEIIDYQLS